MENKIKSIVRTLKVKVIYDECLEGNGYYLPSINTVVVNNNLDDFARQKTLLHELGHAAMHHDNYKLYKITFILHSKMEAEADYYMIENMVDEHDGAYNYTNLIETFKIGIGYEDRYQRLN